LLEFSYDKGIKKSNDLEFAEEGLNPNCAIELRNLGLKNMVIITGHSQTHKLAFALVFRKNRPLRGIQANCQMNQIN
jgi:hypothetical protein